MRAKTKVSAALLLFLPAFVALVAAPAGGSYDDLVRLFQEWRAFQKPKVVEGVPDYTAAAMDAQKRALPAMRSRLDAIDTSGWPVAQKVDWELVRAEMNGLDFDHRVLKPWSRNPCFYTAVIAEESDTPVKEGPAFAGAIPVFDLKLPLSAEAAADLHVRLAAVPRTLEQAKKNLVDDARDLWMLGVRVQKAQASELESLAGRLAPHHPALAEDARRAKAAVEGFGRWIEGKVPEKRAPSGVGVANYDWYLKNVHLVPYGWRDEAALMRREHGRSLAALALERHRNRALPELAPIASEDEWKKRAEAAVADYVRFLRERDILTVTPYMEPALRAHVEGFTPPDKRDFFAQVEVRDPFMLRLHGFHWIDKARMKSDPHPSPIRRGALLYNIWDGRSEGNATAFEEMMTTAGLLDAHPRSRELVDVLVANRAARGLAGLLVHSGELSIEQAVKFASEGTPYGWLKADGDLVFAEQQNYLEQPGYSTCYITGKAQIEALLGERAKQLGADFTLKRFFDEYTAAGMIPVSLIRWELTGKDDEIRALKR